MKKHDHLPTYEEAKKAVESGNADSIEQFIHDHEPGNSVANSGLPDYNGIFRSNLKKALSVHPEYSKWTA